MGRAEIRSTKSEIRNKSIDDCLVNARGRPAGARFFRPPAGRPRSFAMQTSIKCEIRMFETLESSGFEFVSDFGFRASHSTAGPQNSSRLSCRTQVSRGCRVFRQIDQRRAKTQDCHVVGNYLLAEGFSGICLPQPRTGTKPPLIYGSPRSQPAWAVQRNRRSFLAMQSPSLSIGSPQRRRVGHADHRDSGEAAVLSGRYPWCGWRRRSARQPAQRQAPVEQSG